MKKILFLVSALFLIFSCTDPQNTENTPNSNGLLNNNNDYLVFERIHPKCVGEHCVEAFKLTLNKLYEDSVDDKQYHSYNFSITLSDEKHQQTKDILNSFPTQLFDESDGKITNTIGLYDQPIIVVRTFINNKKRFWVIDTDNHPDYLKSFIKAINLKINNLQS